MSARPSKSRPPLPTPAAAPSFEDYVQGAVGKEAKPWEIGPSRDEVRREFHADLSDVTLRKVEYLARLDKTSKRAIVDRALREWCDAELERRDQL